MTRLWCMRGYSGSGKSTKAYEIAKEHGAVVVNRDYLRRMILGDWWTGEKGDEDKITVAERALVDSYLRAGTPVVVDATHLNPSYLRWWARFATRLGVEFEVVDVREELADCIWQDKLRAQRGERAVGEGVILRQAKKWPQEKWPTISAEKVVIEPYKPERHTPAAIIVDVDGTLAHNTSGRSPYDYSRVREDQVDLVVRNLVNRYYDNGYRVLIVSGRDHSCYMDTRQWLIDNRVEYHVLHTRMTYHVDDRGNKLPDWQVKLDIFNTSIRHRYAVQFVLDDRDQVVEMWRKLGLKCLQVAEGDF